MAHAPRDRYPGRVLTERTRRRAGERIALLADSVLDSDALRREAIEVLRGAIGFDRWCTLLLDPDTLVIARASASNDWHDELPRLNLHEASLGDVNNHAMLARSRIHVGVLSAATGGDLARSRRWRECLGAARRRRRARLRGRGRARLLGRLPSLPLRATTRPFSAEDAQLMRELSSLLARGLRRGAVAPMEGGRADAPDAAMGVLLAQRGPRSRAARPRPREPGSRRSTRPGSRSPMGSRVSSGTSSGG